MGPISPAGCSITFGLDWEDADSYRYVIPPFYPSFHDSNRDAIGILSYCSSFLPTTFQFNFQLLFQTHKCGL